MFNVVYFEPEIPFNTGATIRLCANTGSQLHLIEPLAFEMDDKRLRRAGLDYHEYVNVKTWPDYDNFTEKNKGRIYACSTHAGQLYADCHFQPGDSFLFGPETRGLPPQILERFPDHLAIRIPMSGQGRSLNLANATAVIVYEAWRQNAFANGDQERR